MTDDLNKITNFHKYLPIAFAIITVIALMNITINSNQGTHGNHLDEIAIDLKHAGYKDLSFYSTWVSAKLKSPHAQMIIANKMVEEGDLKAARELYFEAVWKAPFFGLSAGKHILAYARTKQDIALATQFLTDATLITGSPEAFRLLAYITLGNNWQASCDELKRAFHWFEKAAKRGDEYSQLIMGIAYGSGRGVNKSPKTQFAYLVLAERSQNNKVANLAESIIQSLYSGELKPDDTKSDWDRYISEKKHNFYLSKALKLGLSEYDYLRYSHPQSLPDICHSTRPQSDCNPYKELCNDDGTPYIRPLHHKHSSCHSTLELDLRLLF